MCNRRAWSDVRGGPEAAAFADIRSSGLYPAGRWRIGPGRENLTTLSDDLRTLSYEAFVYFYPLVTMNVTRLQAFSAAPGSRPGFGPPNQFSHVRQFPPAAFRSVVRPNFDTLYSIAWLDLSHGPVRLQAGDTDDRFYMLPMIDMWTDVFANPGKRTTGTGPLDLVITGPGYSWHPPAESTVVPAPTPHVWIIGRTQTNGPDDYAAVHKVQDGFRLTELGPKIDVTPDPDADITTEPLKVVDGMTALDYFSCAADLLRVNPAHATDFSPGRRSSPVTGPRPRFAGSDAARANMMRRSPKGDLHGFLDAGRRCGRRCGAGIPRRT